MSKNKSSNSLSYQDAGVDIEQASALVDNIQKIAANTNRPEVLGGIGGFAALYALPAMRYQEPVLVSSTDGVGTKLKIASQLNRHDTIGIDLVAMCVNDVICQGAEPLFFLDYLATGSLKPKQAQAILTGIGKGCQLAGAALIGGETAEMPGMYQEPDYDLAGFCVGAVEKAQLIDGSQVKAGNTLIALASSGVHSNGFSLIRKVLTQTSSALDAPFDETTLGDALLTPTRIYAKSILNLLAHCKVNAIAHITGGGLLENLPRVLPKHTQAIIDSTSWQWPEIFHWIQSRGNIAKSEMYRTFNMGVGMVICVESDLAEKALAALASSGEQAWVIGYIAANTESKPTLEIK